MKYHFAVITGASSGIGLAFAKELAKRGSNILLIARREDLLKKISLEITQQYSVQCHVLNADLSIPGEAKRVREYCEKQLFPVDLLVNNAGKGHWGPFDQLQLTDNLNSLDLNIRSLTEMTGEFYELLKQRPSGVINVASTAAFQAIPYFAVYAASKSYVLSFSRALHHEWKEFGIHVTALCPGGTATEFMDVAKMDHLKPITHRYLMSPQKVVNKALCAVEKNHPEVLPGFTNWLGSKLAQFAPRCLTEMLLGKIFR